jgi:hypothetical protein
VLVLSFGKTTAQAHNLGLRKETAGFATDIAHRMPVVLLTITSSGKTNGRAYSKRPLNGHR